ncbi:RNase H [Tangfeifania diversioriginum]|uniref:RNase H n=1 Tax=Tangfeifania diversioriginum TaxID=1168035 RepID=A0A1M6F6Z1_9BACT|nr:RNase H family protein [Tangfeifania diversioriginum]SHI93433.1 RNase H [Tangfeifania diversioriginum]
MKELLLFTDGSVNTKTKIGIGACLAVENSEISSEKLKKEVKIKQFENTSSTRLELETLLWALGEMASSENAIIVYTDSQNITGLLRRRERLEKNDFRSKNNRLMNNHDLYREFFRVIDEFECEFVKVTGHQPTRGKDKIHRLFTLVDRASRKALRKYRG